MISVTVAPENEFLHEVRIRLLAENEVGQFNFYLEREHYLESSRFAGQSLRYVAEVDGQWVALLTFSAPALHLKARERWIGWTPRQRARRLGWVVNSSRFLVLPERQRYPNLASRVLGLVLRRLIAEWQERWAHPVLVVGMLCRRVAVSRHVLSGLRFPSCWCDRGLQASESGLL